MRPLFSFIKISTQDPRSVVCCLLSVVCCLGLLLGGCAKVGDPLPPLVLYPGTVTDLTAAQVGDHFQIVFSLPPQEIEWVEIYRRCGEDLSFTEQAEALARVEGNKLSRHLEEGKFFFEDHPGWSQTCRYGLRFGNRQGRRSPFSNFVETVSIPSAQPPTNLRYQLHQDRLVFRWDPPTENIDGSRPPHLVGYLVNSQHLVSEPEYSDFDFQFGEMQTYRVQSVSRGADPLILSQFSDTLRTVPRDAFPPETPQNITAFFLEGEVQVLWNANRETDLDGYFIYSGPDPNRLEKSSASITINKYVDDSVEPGKTYYYQLSAVDRTGNESPKSETISITLE